MTVTPEAADPSPDARNRTSRHRRPLLLAFGLDGLALGAFVAAIVVIGSRGPRVGPDEGFFADPLPAGLMVLAFAATIAAGAGAAWTLVREPLQTRKGRWAVRLAIAFAVSMPVLGVITEVFGLEQGWAEPLVPPIMLTALGAMLLGGLAREPARRGLLLIPLVIGTSALTFALGEVLVPHEMAIRRGGAVSAPRERRTRAPAAQPAGGRGPGPCPALVVRREKRAGKPGWPAGEAADARLVGAWER